MDGKPMGIGSKHGASFDLLLGAGADGPGRFQDYGWPTSEY